MITLDTGLLGLLAYVLGTVILGAWLRRHPTQGNAEKSSRVLHFFFFAGLGAPFILALFYPGLNHLDELAGLPPLPGESWQPTFISIRATPCRSGIP
jgi:hypothetical protein